MNGATMAWRLSGTGFAYAPGQGGLVTGRLTCHLFVTVATPGTVTFSDGFLADRMGWREITATPSSSGPS
ncbi:hypothetical protein ACQPYK_02420 [Streptosporangium sp. CA-135522]|uniref:hypothetical protein n=1 Tax=Streptosporangium sp. CA-135522 TaxID=3240072 RepID=UPI003D8F7B1A